MKIAVVVPTNRPEKIEQFKKDWKEQFQKHDVALYIVYDGKVPISVGPFNQYSSEPLMGKENKDLIHNFNDGVRNLGFVHAYGDGADIIISLDDDTAPYGDTIGDHLNVLEKRTCVSWINTANKIFMRGIPYHVRGEAPVVLSHGVWKGVADFDASTQLVLGTPEVEYGKSSIPKGILFPMCMMNTAFKRCMMPYMYQAPMYGDINRFADIWGGIEAKKDADKRRWAIVSGFATIIHNRASDPIVNLVKEAKGIQMNEQYGQGDYFKMFFAKRKRWRDFIQKL